MRESLAEFEDVESSDITGPPRRTRGMWAFAIALIASLALAAAAVIDQVVVRGLAEHVRAMYAPYGLHPDPSVQYALVYTVAGIGVVLWLITMLRVRTGSGRVVAIVSIAITTLLAVVMFTVAEYGEALFPAFWGILSLVSPVVGILATLLLFRRTRVD